MNLYPLNHHGLLQMMRSTSQPSKVIRSFSPNKSPPRLYILHPAAAAENLSDDQLDSIVAEENSHIFFWPFGSIHPRNLAWNLKISPWKMDFPFPGTYFQVQGVYAVPIFVFFTD